MLELLLDSQATCSNTVQCHWFEIRTQKVGFQLKDDSSESDLYHETGKACLSRHETDLYQKAICIMKQVNFKIITSCQ